MVAVESTEGRFAHLLRPIRELTRNWEIDVASELNDYLEELDEMRITFDGGKLRLNFAEAALLLQGSACIYSKKVELLSNLVYQTLEYINDRNKKRNKAAAAAEEDDDAQEAASRQEDDALDEFTPLDIEVSGNEQKSCCSASVRVAPLPPASLIPPEANEKRRLPLLSVKGDVVCSLKDFRINHFVPQDDLILLSLRHHGDALDWQPQGPSAPQLDDPVEEQEEEEAGGGGAADDLLPVMEVEERVDRHQAPMDVPAVRERRWAEADGRRPAAEAPPAVDVWAFHDLYAAAGHDKPFKPGKYYKVPDGLDDGGKRKRRRGAALQDFRSWFTGTFNPPGHKLKNGPAFTDLNHVYLSSLKERIRTQRRIYRRAGLLVSEEELRQSFLQPEEAGPQQGEEPVEELRHCHLLGGGDDDDASDNEDEGFLDDVPAEFAGGDDFMAADALSYEELVKLRVEQLMVNSRGYTQETALSRRVKDWEDKIRPELDLQEQRPPFDIHDYGRRIVESLGGVGQRRTFAAIVHGLDNFEVCKYLLASLQLANDYTVELDSCEALEDRCDSLSVALLSTLRATDRFKDLTTAS